MAVLAAGLVARLILRLFPLAVLVFLLLSQNHPVSPLVDIALVELPLGFLVGVSPPSLPLEILFSPFAFPDKGPGGVIDHGLGFGQVLFPGRVTEVAFEVFVVEAVVRGDVVRMPFLVVARLALLTRFRGEHLPPGLFGRGMKELLGRVSTGVSKFDP